MRTRLKLTAPTATLDTPNPISSTESTRRLPMIWLLVHILPRSSFLPDQPGKPRILLLLLGRSRGPKSPPNFSSFSGSRGRAAHPRPAGATEGRRGGPGAAGPRAGSAAPAPSAVPSAAPSAVPGAAPSAALARRSSPRCRAGGGCAAPRS